MPIVLIFLLSLTHSVMAGPIHGNPGPDLNAFEAITGESVDDDHSVWDSFYKKKDHAFGTEAVGFLKENLKRVKKGRAFIPAMGEGRNAIFIARNGFEVEGVDLSSVAVDRAIEDARKQRTNIKGVVADLFQYHYPKETYDLIFVSLFYSEKLIPKFRQALKKGGYMMLYLKRETVKPSPNVGPDDFLVRSGDLKAALHDFDILIYKEFTDQKTEVMGALVRKR